MGANSSKGGSVKGAGKLIAALRAAETPEAVLRLATTAGERGELSPAAASAALQRLAALLPRGGATLRGDSRFTALCSLLTTRQPAGVRPRTLANVLYAFGALAAAPDADWLRRAESAAASALPEMSAEDAANVIWGLTVCGHRPNAKWLAAWTAAWHSRLVRARVMEIAACLRVLTHAPYRLRYCRRKRRRRALRCIRRLWSARCGRAARCSTTLARRYWRSLQRPQPRWRGQQRRPRWRTPCGRSRHSARRLRRVQQPTWPQPQPPSSQPPLRASWLRSSGPWLP
jgi:hypothetical protein